MRLQPLHILIIAMAFVIGLIVDHVFLAKPIYVISKTTGNGNGAHTAIGATERRIAMGYRRQKSVAACSEIARCNFVDLARPPPAHN